MTDLIAQERAETAYDALMERVGTTLEATGDRFPFAADPNSGEWEETDDGNWCAGHWIGLLWLASEYADSPEETDRFETAAGDHTEVMLEAMPRTTKFCGVNFHHAGWTGYDITGDRQLFAVGLEGADAMVEQFHEAARQIAVGRYRIKGPAEQFEAERAYEDRPPGDRLAVCDSIYTSLPVLWRAYEETGYERFRDVALAHADRHLDWYLEEDGSTTHMVAFDPESGKPEQYFDTLAYDSETCWARGQGWHIAGLSYAYNATGASRYLEALERSVDYYREHTPEDLVPFWDFEDPRIPEVPKDTSCAGLVAYGLLQLELSEETTDLRTFGARVLEAIITDYLVLDDSPYRGMVLEGCYTYPNKYHYDSELIWTNYYVARAIKSII